MNDKMVGRLILKSKHWGADKPAIDKKVALVNPQLAGDSECCCDSLMFSSVGHRLTRCEILVPESD